MDFEDDFQDETYPMDAEEGLTLQSNDDEVKSKKRDQNDRLRRKNDQLAEELNRLRNENIALNKKVLDVEDTKLNLLSTNISWAKKLAAADNDVATIEEAEEHLKTVERSKYELEAERQNIIRAQSESQNSELGESARLRNEFLKRNPLINYMDPSNPNYSPQAYKMVEDISARLSMRYKMEGRGEEDLSEGYFNELENLYKKELNMETNNNNNYNTRRNLSTPVSSGTNYLGSARNDEVKLSPQAKRTMEGFLRHAINDEHKVAIKKRYMEAARNNWVDPNINI